MASEPGGVDPRDWNPDGTPSQEIVLMATAAAALPRWLAGERTGEVAAALGVEASQVADAFASVFRPEDVRALLGLERYLSELVAAAGAVARERGPWLLADDLARASDRLSLVWHAIAVNGRRP
jgi:hypothetical protein